jgi:hypothetical protein
MFSKENKLPQENYKSEIKTHWNQWWKDKWPKFWNVQHNSLKQTLHKRSINEYMKRCLISHQEKEN